MNGTAGFLLGFVLSPPEGDTVRERRAEKHLSYLHKNKFKKVAHFQTERRKLRLRHHPSQKIHDKKKLFEV